MVDEPLPPQDTTAVMVDDDDDEEEEDVFVRPIHYGTKKGARKPSSKPIKIVLNGVAAGVILESSSSSSLKHHQGDVAVPPPLRDSIPQVEVRDDFVVNLNDLEELDEELEHQVQDSLKFFQETHEDQDPAFAAFSRKLAEEERQKNLAALDAYDQQTRKEIEALIADLCKEKQAATDKSLEKYKQRAVQDEMKNTECYKELYRQKAASNVRKINEGIDMLQQRHRKDLQTAMGHHQQQARIRRLPEQMAASEWHATSQQITSKHNQQLAAFRNKGDELKKKTETDYQREQEKIRKQYLQKLQEVAGSRSKLHAKIEQQFLQLRQRYLKRHLQKIMKEKEELLSQGPAIVTAMSSAAGESTESAEGDLTSSGSSLKPFAKPLELAKSTMEERAELNPPTPVRIVEKWVDELQYQTAGAATRHKHRKGVMSQTVRQLTMEIHNEGLWLAACPVDSDNNNSSAKNKEAPPLVEYEFIPWGVKAHQILDAVVAGEIPPGTCERILDKHANAADLMALQAGQVRCIISDLRTSEETASSHRAIAVAEQEECQLKELEQHVAKMQKEVTDAETAFTRAAQEEKDQTTAVLTAEEDLKNAKRNQEEFKHKFKSFLGPDGNPIPEAKSGDRQELSKAMLRYKTVLEAAANKAKVAKQTNTETKATVQKLQTMVKTAQKNLNMAISILKKKQSAALDMITAGNRGSKVVESAERSSFRVKDVIGALRKAADRRRDLSDQKKSTSFSSAWVQSFPGLPSSLKKSLWHKMHRRKQQVILRPTPESLITELRASVAANVAAKITGRSNSVKNEIIEAEMMNAEQLYLLATHPLTDEPLSSVPPTKSSDNWAEPGWKLDLSVPNDDAERMQKILPCARSFPVFESNLSEMASAPGRQAASLLRTSHFRCLASPLSTFAVASSPAESNTSLAQTRAYADGDPLYITDEEMTLGYAFTLKQQPSKPAAPRKKTPATNAQTDAESHNDSAATTRPSLSGTSVGSASGMSEQPAGHSDEPSKHETKRRRPSKKVTGTAPAPSSRSKKPKLDTMPVAAQTNPAAPPHYNQMMQPQPPPPTQQQRQSQQAHHNPQHLPPPPRQKQQLVQQQRHHQLPRHPPPHQPPHQPQHQPQQHPQQHPQQQQYSPQIAQLRMIQQQQQQQALSPRHQQVTANYAPQAIQQMQQFYAPLNHPPPSMPPNHMQGRPGPPHPPPPQGMPALGQSGQPRNQGDPNNSNDPLFMLK